MLWGIAGGVWASKLVKGLRADPWAELFSFQLKRKRIAFLRQLRFDRKRQKNASDVQARSSTDARITNVFLAIRTIDSWRSAKWGKGWLTTTVQTLVCLRSWRYSCPGYSYIVHCPDTWGNIFSRPFCPVQRTGWQSAFLRLRSPFPLYLPSVYRFETIPFFTSAPRYRQCVKSFVAKHESFTSMENYDIVVAPPNGNKWKFEGISSASRAPMRHSILHRDVPELSSFIFLRGFRETIPYLFNWAEGELFFRDHGPNSFFLLSFSFL